MLSSIDITLTPIGNGDDAEKRQNIRLGRIHSLRPSGYDKIE